MGYLKKQKRIVDPRCLLCDFVTEPVVIYYDDDFMIKGWKCPHCGSSVINPSDIPKALKLLRTTVKV